MEAPKNIFLALYAVCWLVNSLRQKNFGHLPRFWDALFALAVLSPLLSVAFSSPYPRNWNAMGDIVSNVILVWTVARSRLEAPQVRYALISIVVATILGLVQGYYVLATDSARQWLQLNSVGHVNHSALYGAAAAVIGAALSFVAWREQSVRQRYLGLIGAFVLFAGIIGFASRGGLVTYLFGLAFAALPLLMSKGRRALMILSILLVAGGICMQGAQYLVVWASHGKNQTITISAKNAENLRTRQVLSERDRLARNAIEHWRQRPVLGDGPTNFSAVSPEMVKSWVEARGEVFDADKFFFSNHAHNVYMNTLAERGALGALLLLVLGAAWAFELWRRRPQTGTAATGYLAWAAGAGGWSIAFVGGLFNTTLHHEHGMLVLFGLGLLLGSSSHLVQTHDASSRAQ